MTIYQRNFQSHLNVTGAIIYIIDKIELNIQKHHHSFASLFLTTILYGSTYKRYCEYKQFHSAISNPIEINNISEDVNMDVPRSRSTALSPNSLRESSTYSNLSSQLYADRMEAENEKFSWDKQVESQNF